MVLHVSDYWLTVKGVLENQTGRQADWDTEEQSDVGAAFR